MPDLSTLNSELDALATKVKTAVAQLKADSTSPPPSGVSQADVDALVSRIKDLESQLDSASSPSSTPGPTPGPTGAPGPTPSPAPAPGATGGVTLPPLPSSG